MQEEREGSEVGAEEEDINDMNVHEAEKNDELVIGGLERSPSPSRNVRKEASVTKILRRYIQNALASGQPPLPVLNRVSGGYLPLLNYQLNATNAQSLARATQEIVPGLVHKLYLVNNSLKDPGTA